MKKTSVQVSKIVIFIALFTVHFAISAAEPARDPLTGLWEQTDDKSGKVQALIRLTKTGNDTYVGVVEKIIPEPGDDPNPKCDKCRDHRRDKPVLGMQIIDGLIQTGAGVYERGNILDPDEGEIYRLKITVLEGGAKLDVRGYIGISLFGRSQIWRRAS
jgi:uncharacterized protein (DUF2147 family)